MAFSQHVPWGAPPTPAQPTSFVHRTGVYRQALVRPVIRNGREGPEEQVWLEVAAGADTGRRFRCPVSGLTEAEQAICRQVRSFKV